MIKEINASEVKVGDVLFWEKGQHHWTHNQERLFAIVIKKYKESDGDKVAVAYFLTAAEKIIGDSNICAMHLRDSKIQILC